MRDNTGPAVEIDAGALDIPPRPGMSELLHPAFPPQLRAVPTNLRQPMTALLHELLSQSQARTPQHVAVQMQDTSLTYAELHQRSQQLASCLSRRGVEKGARVGLLIKKSCEAYVGIYGILQAGAAYVPLDIRAPTDRLAYIADDCGVEVVLATKATIRVLAEICSKAHSIRTVILLDEVENGLSDMDGVETVPASTVYATVPDNDVHVVGSDLAYILYTSGSTGRPKGVMISHAVSMSFVEWSATTAHLQQSDRVSGHAPFHFDLSVFDTFATALSGGTLYPVPEGSSTFPASLIEWIVKSRISVWYSVPSILSMMASHSSFASQSFPDLRLVLFAGEVFPAKYLRRWREVATRTSFMNWYGPTETNVITSYSVTEGAGEIDAPVPIGKPTSNADLFLLDDDGCKIEEAGRSGELHARGPCVALGYWGDEEKSRMSFLPNSDQPWLGDRVYRTGDLASRNSNGDYIYLGRADHQIKSRGYRIELGEIESALYRLEQIEEAAVVPVPDDVVGNRLHAFVALRGDCAGNSREILDGIAAFLPAYMMPEVMTVEMQLPKTSNGKIDRQSLQNKAETQSASKIA